MKRIGPAICFSFFVTQAIHVYFYGVVVGPRFREKYAWMEPLTSMVYALGWFLCWKVTYLYYRVALGNPGTTKDLKNLSVKESEYNYLLPLNKSVVQKYSRQMAELVRYSPVAVHDFDTLDQALSLVPREEGLFCLKCKDMKPLRAHHCSVCNRCTLLMDHHCMWTNNCIGLHNYKQFV